MLLLLLKVIKLVVLRWHLRPASLGVRPIPVALGHSGDLHGKKQNEIRGNRLSSHWTAIVQIGHLLLMLLAQVARRCRIVSNARPNPKSEC